MRSGFVPIRALSLPAARVTRIGHLSFGMVNLEWRES